MKRKFIIGLLVTSVALTATACGKSNQTTQPPVSSTAPVVESVAEEIAEPVVQESEEKNYRAAAEIRESTAATPMFQFGETQITIGQSLLGDLFDGDAEFVPNEIVDSTEYALAPGQEVEVNCTFEESPFKVTILNDTKAESSVKNGVISSVYADQGPFFAVGGVKLGDPSSELSLALGDPYTMEEGVDTYADITAYHYASHYNDKNVTFFVSNTEDAIVSFYERIPVNYIESTDDISDMEVMDLIEEREKNVPSYLTNSPYILDVEGSDLAASELNDITFTNVKVYSLNEIRDTFSFDTTAVPVNYVCVEYEARLDYNEQDISNLVILTDTVDTTYNVYGCFYLTNAYVDMNGNIKSDNMVHELDGVYSDETLMFENIIPSENGYSINDYYETNMELM